jgi:hypothetical protein
MTGCLTGAHFDRIPGMTERNSSLQTAAPPVEMLSSAFTLSDMEIFIFPELL